MFIIPALTGGGAEKVITLLLKYINREKFTPILVLIKKIGPFVGDIPTDIKLIDLKCRSTKSAFLKIFHTIRVEKPHVVMSTLGHLNLIIALLKFFLPQKIFYIARESNIISLHNKNEKYPLIFNFLFRTVYKNFDKIICQSRSMKDDLVKEFFIPSDKIETINNPIDFKAIEKLKLESTGTKFSPSKTYFLAAGRLTEQKSFSRLIKSFSMTKNRNNHLIIMGDG
ncbi:MAG: glycosyltransferase, partial [Bacteroidota bacterium]|nr:glycosyltransferase [Bacteroidota bacterium]